MVRTFKQFVKFGIIGVSGTIIDLGILNVLMFMSGHASGVWFPVFKGLSTSIAIMNSYFWNRNWTFKSQNDAKVMEFGKFFVTSIIGLGINVGAASFVVNVIKPLGDISPQLWANVGAISAISVSMIWNFLCYKFVVFNNEVKYEENKY